MDDDKPIRSQGRFPRHIRFRCSEHMHALIVERVQKLELASITDYIRQVVLKDLQTNE